MKRTLPVYGSLSLLFCAALLSGCAEQGESFDFEPVAADDEVYACVANDGRHLVELQVPNGTGIPQELVQFRAARIPSFRATGNGSYLCEGPGGVIFYELSGGDGAAPSAQEVADCESRGGCDIQRIR